MGYKGRHRKPTHKARNAATILGATAIAYSGSSMLPQVAVAGPPGGWEPIIECESGDRNIENQSDVNSTASGYLQFVNGTWRHFGGTQFAPRAIQATKSEQLVVAERAFEANGLRDWTASQHCWGSKVAGSTRVNSTTAARHTARARTPATAPSRIHVVRSGDTLSGIAGTNWHSLWERNKEVIGSNPNLIFPGQTLKL